MASDCKNIQRPRVLHLDHSIEAGGAELALLRLVNKAVGWEPSVLLPKQRVGGLGVFENLKPGTRLETTGPPQVPGVSSKNSFRGVLGFAGQILGQAFAVRVSPQFREADVVHANTSRSSLYGAIACLGTNKKLVLHLRDHISQQSLGTIGHLAFKLLSLRRANGLIANSKSTLTTASAILGSRAIPSVVIPSSIGISATERSTREDSQALAAPLRIGMIARIDPWKGQALLLQAFALAFPNGDEQLVFAGGCLFGHEEYLASLKRDVIARGLEGRVEFLGHIEQISTVITAMDICVQASMRPEPLGQNVLQYLAAGRAVVASNEGGPAEWIEHGQNGLLFEPRNPQSLALALESLAENVELLVRLQRCAPETPGLLTDDEVSAAHGKMFREIAS